MSKKLILNLTLIMLLLIGCSSTAQDDPQASPPDVVTETQAEIEDTTTQDEPQAFPPDVVTEIQAKIDDLTAGGLPPGMVVWSYAPEYPCAGATGRRHGPPAGDEAATADRQRGHINRARQPGAAHGP